MLINGRVSVGMMVIATPDESISRPSSSSKPIVIGGRGRCRSVPTFPPEARFLAKWNMVANLG